MTRRKERTLKELYDLTERLSQPEITPVLEGSCRIQGPVDELDQDLRMNTEALPEKNILGDSPNKNVRMRAESGTCNVCAAPCSSCMHYNQTISTMESKIEDEFSAEICKAKEPLFKSKAFDDRQHTASEASNFFSASSSHDSLSENAESKATMRICETSDAFVDVEMLPKLSSDETTEKDQCHTTPCNIVAQSPSNSHRGMLSDLDQRNSTQCHEQQELECHGDNLSCVTGFKDANVPVGDHIADSDKKNSSQSAASTSSIVVEGKAVQVQTASDCPTDSLHEIAGSKHDSMRSSTSTKDTFQKKRSALTADASESPSSKDVYAGPELHTEPSECSLETQKFSLAEPATITSVDEQQKGSAPLDSSNMHSNIEGGKANPIRSNFSSGVQVDMDKREPQAESRQTDVNQQLFNGLHEVSDIQDAPLQSPIANSEHSESDILEDDVKVCDICGDTGREESLAICSRCSDGAEHTYCMRIMLDKLPDGDWLCEECQLKEDAEKRKLDKAGMISAAPKALFSTEKSQNCNPKLKLDTKVQEEQPDKAIKVSTSPQVSTKRHAETLEVNSLSKKVPVETSAGLAVIASINRKPALSRESSFKRLDVGKVKPAHSIPLAGSLSANSSQEMAHCPASAQNSSRMQAHLHSPRGSLSRPATFNNVNSKPKVKQLSGDFSQKQNLTKDITSSSMRKEGLARTISKSISFNSTSSSNPSSNESKAKLQPANLSCSVDPRGLKQTKEQLLIERKNSFRSDRPLVSSSPVVVTSTLLPKSDLKLSNSRDPRAAQLDGKPNTSSKQVVITANKVSENAVAPDGGYEVNKQSSSGHPLGISSLHSLCSSEEQSSCEVDPKEDPTTNGSPDTNMKDVLPQSRGGGKTKEAPNLSWSRQTVSVGSKNVRCHKCNEMGHIAQFCTAGSLRVSALKASAFRSSRELTHKSSKWRDIVESAMSKTRIHKNDRLPGRFDLVSVSSTDMSSEGHSKDQLSSSSGCVENMPSPGGTLLGKEALRHSVADSRTTAILNVKQHGSPATETLCAPRVADPEVVPTISDEAKPRPPAMSLPIQASIFANPFKNLAIPEHNYIWQGRFEVLRIGGFHDVCDGIQAHLSTCASPKVLEMVNKFPSSIDLEEVPRLTSWPAQFRSNCPTEDNIALYFFATDFESYARSYKKLLENMLENDLALKGKLDGIELLIFPSNQLSEKSHRWNRLFFLWAVFMERRWNHSESFTNPQKKFRGATLGTEPAVQDFPTHVRDEDSYRHDRSPKAYSLNRLAAEDTLPSEKHTSFSFPGTHASAITSQQACLPSTCSSSRMTMTDAQLCSEKKSTSASLKEVYRDSKGGESTELQPRVQVATEQLDLNEGKAVNMYLGSHFRQTSFASSLLDRRSECSKIFPVSSSSLVKETGLEHSGVRKFEDREEERWLNNETSSERNMPAEPLMKEEDSWESKCCRKRMHPNSSYSEASDKALKKANQTGPWKEVECIQIDEQSECKKMKVSTDSYVGSSQGQSFGDGFSSNILSADPTVLNKVQKSKCIYDDAVIPEGSRAPERFFFPVETGPLSDCKSGHSMQWKIPSLDNHDPPEADVPNLELALGAEKKSSKQGFFPLFPQSVNEKSSQNKLPEPQSDDGDDSMSSSLSLSLAFPFSEDKQYAKSAPKTEQLLPERQHANTSLLLFGRFRDS